MVIHYRQVLSIESPKSVTFAMESSVRFYKHFIFAFVIGFIFAKPICAQWLPINLRSNVSINAFAINGTNLFAGTKFGLYSSTNNGKSWNYINIGLSNSTVPLDILSLVVNNGMLFAGTKFNNISEYNGIYRSTNNGATWQPIGLDTESIYALVASDSIVFALTSSGMYRSTDHGVSWMPSGNEFEIQGLDPIPTAMQSITVNNNNIYATGDRNGNGIYRSTDNGKSWLFKGSVLPSNGQILAPAIYSLLSMNGYLYAGTFGFGVYRSTDSGTSWDPINQGLPVDSSAQELFPLAYLNGKLYVGTDSGVFISNNDGLSWVGNNSGMPIDPNIFNGISCFLTSNDYIFEGTFGGWSFSKNGNLGVFFSSDEGANWTAVDAGLDYGYLYLFPKASFGDNLYAGAINPAGTRGVIYHSTDYGSSWNGENIGAVEKNAFIEDDGRIFAGTTSDNQDASVFLSVDSGAIWSPVNMTFWQNRFNTTIDLSGIIVLDVNQNNLFAATMLSQSPTNGLVGNWVFRSTDDGQDWIESDLGLPTDFVTVLVTSGDTIFAGTDSGLYRSTNNGDFWTVDTFGLGAKDISALILNGDNLFAGTGGNSSTNIGDGIYHSTDHGDSWTQCTDGLLPNSIGEAFCAINGNIFVGTDKGVFQTTDNGKQWKAINEGLPNSLLDIGSLVVCGNYIFANTINGIFRRPLSELAVNVVDNSTSNTAATFTLEQNYPNPFSFSTSFEFYMPHDGFATLKIFNILGKEVSSLIDGACYAGKHLITFDGRNLKDGLYFYKLIIENNSMSGIMCIVR